MKRLFLALLTLLTLPLIAAPELTVKLSSAHLVKGETTHLRIYVSEDYLDADPVLPKIEGLEIAQIESRRPLTLQEKRQRVASYVFSITAQEEGHYKIPPLKLTANNTVLISPEQKLTVHPRSELEEAFLQFGDRKHPYLTKLFLETDTLYPNQTQRAELKFYFPPQFGLQAPSLPEVPDTTNLAAWRFSIPSAPHSIGSLPFGRNHHQVYTFSTYCNGLQPGKASFGEITTIFRAQVSTRRPGLFQSSTRSFPLPSATAEFNVIPFPPGAPAGFEGAIGSYNLEAISPTKLDIKDSESISIRLSIKGEGNLDSINKPVMDPESPWNSIDISEVERGAERRYNSGTLEFDYLIQPKGRTKNLPSFRFVYYDPDKEEYIVKTTQEIPVTITKTISNSLQHATPKAVVPIEAMGDILGIIDPVKPPTSPSFWETLPFWWWQPIPALIALSLILHYFRLKLRSRRLNNSREMLMKQAYKKLQKTDQGFYRAAGAFVEKWLGAKKHDSIDEVLRLRDQHCFSEQETTEPSPQEKQSILKSIKPLLSICFAILFLSPQRGEASAAYTAWQDGDYQKALEQYQALPNSADVEYNLANCWYRLDHPGKAALHYHRALLHDADHPEALQNLRYLHRSLGSLAPPPPESITKTIALLSKPTYLQMIYFAAWLIILTLLVLVLYRLKRTQFTLTLTGLILASLLLGVAYYAHSRYPNSLNNHADLNIIISDDVEAYTEPLTHSKQDLQTVIKAPPGSLCQVLSSRGDWSYVSFFQKSRGWVSNQHLAPIHPPKENTSE